MSEASKEQKFISLQLGDIIELKSEKDSSVDQKKFIIRYIDTELLRIENADGVKELSIVDGRLDNDSTPKVISKSDTPSYAEQFGLLPYKQVDIILSSDIKISGEIQNLVKDQIEILTTEQQTIYIDFAYKGVPLDIPIKDIIVKPNKVSQTPEPSLTTDDVSQTPEPSLTTDDVSDEDTYHDNNPLVFASDDVTFGKDLGSMKQLIELPESEKRFHIDKQGEDMLNNFLSSVPSRQRETTLIKEIHQLINRFKELREEFSEFNTNDNTITPIKIYDNSKPLVESLEHVNKKHYWILPVAKMKKKIYDIDTNLYDGSDTTEIMTLANELLKQKEKYPTPKSILDYKLHLKTTREFSTPFINYQGGTYDFEKEVESPITAIINNEDMFETNVFAKYELTQKKYFTQEYSTSQTIMNDSETRLGKATPNDTILINSYVTLPESTVKFSKINAPSTHIMAKVSLNENFLRYWQLLNKTTKLTQVEVDVLNYRNDSQLDFLKGKKHYYPKRMDDEESSKILSTEIHRKYLEKFVPSTRKFVEEMKSQVQGSLSLHKVTRYLEPFNIHTRDITIEHYKIIRTFIKEKINNFTENIIKQENELLNLSIMSGNIQSNIKLIFYNSIEIYDKIMSEYGIPVDINITDDEIYSRAQAIDNSRLLNAAFSFVSSRLTIINDLPCVEEYERIAREKNDNKSISNEPDECNKYVISKKYLSVDEITVDDGKEIFFDKRYDNTFYDLIKEYEPTLQTLQGHDAKKEFLAGRLIEVNGLRKSEALRDAEAMLRRKRVVMNGDYAILEDSGEPKIFKRKNKRWIEDNTIDKDQLTDETKLFCNFNENCISKSHAQQANTCIDINSEKDAIEKDVEEKIVRDFDVALKQTNDEYVKSNIIVYNKALSNVNMMRKINNHSKNHNHNDSVFETIPSQVVRSPYESLRETILGKSDFYQKQIDISDFVTQFTREANVSEGESEWWYYCKKTNVKLLPTFLKQISTSVIDNFDYNDVIQKICDERGEIGDDRSMWVDKYSGYMITKMSFSTEEGYTEDGFKIQTRDLLFTDEDDPIKPLLLISEHDTSVVRSDNLTRMIIDIVSKMENVLRIDVGEDGKHFIIRSLKKIQKYYGDDIFGKLNIFTLSYLHVYIQTSIPPIKYRIQYPGCKMSSQGFPLFDDGNEGITYISCVASIKEILAKPISETTKKSSKKIAQKNAKRLEKEMIKFLKSQVSDSEIKPLLETKRLYLNDAKLHKEHVDAYTNLYTKSSLLPVMFPVEIENIVRSPQEFFDSFDMEMQSSDINQYTRINVMNGKKILLALRLQHLIENKLQSKGALLQDQYLENACCWDGELNPLKYFSKKDDSLMLLNDEANVIKTFLEKAKTMASARILFAPRETKKKHSKIPPNYSETTIYRAFAILCHSNGDSLDEDDSSICSKNFTTDTEKQTIDEKVEYMKKQNIKHLPEHLMTLMSSLNAKRTIDFYNDITSVPVVFTDKSFEDFIESDDKFSFAETIKNEYYSKLSSLLTETANNNLKSKINKIISFFDNDNMNRNFDKYSFSLTTLRYICLIFPRFSLLNENNGCNGVVPKHWELSPNHELDIANIVNNKYKKIKLESNVINKDEKNVTMMKNELNEINNFLMIQLGKENMKSYVPEIFKFCLFKALNVYISSVEDDESNNMKFAEFSLQMVLFIGNELDNVTIDYETLRKKMKKKEEVEKMKMLDTLTNMDEEARQIDNEKKYNKLGEVWGKGLERSLRVYYATVYDEERNIVNPEMEGTTDFFAGEEQAQDNVIPLGEHDPESE